jgi:hypothetical protein
MYEVERTGFPTSKLVERWLAVTILHLISWNIFAESRLLAKPSLTTLGKFWMLGNCTLQLARRRMKTVRRCSKYLLAD